MQEITRELMAEREAAFVACGLARDPRTTAALARLAAEDHARASTAAPTAAPPAAPAARPARRHHFPRTSMTGYRRAAANPKLSRRNRR
jgi:hypothetical protein